MAKSVLPNLYLVIMAGGSGTRFWPKSTARKPKQLLAFGNSENSNDANHPNQTATLLGMTLKRFDGMVRADQRLIVTTELLQGAVMEQAPGVTVLAEPQGRNTAPCVYWAARKIASLDPTAVMLVMPSDHYIAQPDRFAATVRAAAHWACANDDLVTLGVTPTRPETGYGYLKMASTEETAAMGAAASTAAFRHACSRVNAFVEKPNLPKAREFIEAGNYLWNGGMFVWRAEVVLEAFDRFMPEMAKAWNAAGGDVETAYPGLTATSIDYGVMEKAENVVAFPLDCGWDDLGSWTSIEGLADVLNARRDAGVVTAGEMLSLESNGNIVDAPGKLVALLGVHDLIVVEQGGVILVADKKRAQDIRFMVDEVKKQRPELA